MSNKNKIVTVNLVGGKHIMEIQLPHVFVAFPVTQQGISQMLQDLDESIQKIVNEQKELAAN